MKVDGYIVCALIDIINIIFMQYENDMDQHIFAFNYIAHSNIGT